MRAVENKWKSLERCLPSIGFAFSALFLTEAPVIITEEVFQNGFPYRPQIQSNEFGGKDSNQDTDC